MEEYPVIDPQSLEYKLSQGVVFYKGGSSKPKPVYNTSSEKALAEISLKKYGRYIDVYRPMEMAAIKDITGEPAGQRIERWAGGRLNADATQSLAATGGPLGDPSQGMLQRINPARAASIAQAAGEQAGLARKQKLAGLAKTVSIGTGQASDAQLGFEGLAQQSINKAIGQQEVDFNQRADNLNLAGAGIGLAGGIAKNEHQNYKNKA